MKFRVYMKDHEGMEIDIVRFTQTDAAGKLYLEISQDGD